MGYIFCIPIADEVNHLTYTGQWMTYVELLEKAQLASNRKEALSVLCEARLKELIEKDDELQALLLASEDG